MCIRDRSEAYSHQCTLNYSRFGNLVAMLSDTVNRHFLSPHGLRGCHTKELVLCACWCGTAFKHCKTNTFLKHRDWLQNTPSQSSVCCLIVLCVENLQKQTLLQSQGWIWDHIHHLNFDMVQLGNVRAMCSTTAEINTFWAPGSPSRSRPSFHLILLTFKCGKGMPQILFATCWQPTSPTNL